MSNHQLAKEKAEQVVKITKKVAKEESSKPPTPKPSSGKEKSVNTVDIVKTLAEGCGKKPVDMLTSPLESVSKESVSKPVSLESNNAPTKTAPKKKKKKRNKQKETLDKQKGSGPSDPGSNSGPKLTGSP